MLSKILTNIVGNLIKVNSNLTCRIFIKIIHALLLARTVRLSYIASFMGKENPSVGMRYLQRFLSRIRWNWTDVCRPLYKTLCEGQRKVVVTMDRTAWELGSHVYNMLVIGVYFNGLTIPLAPLDIGRDGATNFTHMIDVTDTLLSIIPKDKIECLIADREFCALNYLRWLKINKIPFLIRLQVRGMIRLRKEKKFSPMHGRFQNLKVGESRKISHCSLSAENPLPVSLLVARVRRATREDNGLLILAAPVGFSGYTVDSYRLRWSIETSFRCLKSDGFDIERTHLRADNRFFTICMLTIVAFGLACAEGQIKAEATPIPTNHNTSRRRYTIFSIGLPCVIAELGKDWSSGHSVLQHQVLKKSP